MANTSARPEQAFEHIDPKASQKSDGGAVSAAQAAYQPGKKIEFKAQKTSDGTIEFTPLFNPPQANSNAMKAAENTAPVSDSNAMGKKSVKSGWGPYEALDLQVKQKDSMAMRSSEAPSPDEDVKSAKKIQKLLDHN